MIARAVGRVSSCGWVGAARVIADSVHCCQASILAVWLGCMRKFVAARTVKVEELRLSEPGDDCIVSRVGAGLVGAAAEGGCGQPLYLYGFESAQCYGCIVGRWGWWGLVEDAVQACCPCLRKSLQ